MAKTKIRPLGDKIVVKPMNEEEKTESGIVLPDTAEKEKPEKGKVVAVGKGKTTSGGKRRAMDVKVGDVILFSKYGPTEIKIDDEDILVISADDVLAVLE